MLRVAAKPSLKLLLPRLLPLKRALGFPHRPKDLVDCGASRRCVSQFHSKTRRLWASPRMLASGVCGQLVNIRGLLELRLPHRPRERRREFLGECSPWTLLLMPHGLPFWVRACPKAHGVLSCEISTKQGVGRYLDLNFRPEGKSNGTYN